MELYIWFSDLLLFFLRTHGNGTTLLDNSCHVSTILVFFWEKMSALFCKVREMGVAPSSFKSPHKTPKFPSNHTYSLNSPSPFGLGSWPTILFTWIHKRAMDCGEERKGNGFECTIVIVLGDVYVNTMWENFGCATHRSINGLTI